MTIADFDGCHFAQFRWIGPGHARDRRRKDKIYYEKFELDRAQYAVGNYVLIRNDDSVQPEELDNCYIGQIKNVFEDGEQSLKFAEIQWYSRIFELSPTVQKQLGTLNYRRELVKDLRNDWPSVIEVETIFGKCVVVHRTDDMNVSLDSVNSEGQPLFSCRWEYDGRTVNKVAKCLDVRKCMTPKSSAKKSQTKACRSATINDKINSKALVNNSPNGLAKTPKSILKPARFNPFKGRLNADIVKNLVTFFPSKKAEDDTTSQLSAKMKVDSFSTPKKPISFDKDVKCFSEPQQDRKHRKSSERKAKTGVKIYNLHKNDNSEHDFRTSLRSRRRLTLNDTDLFEKAKPEEVKDKTPRCRSESAKALKRISSVTRECNRDSEEETEAFPSTKIHRSPPKQPRSNRKSRVSSLADLEPEVASSPRTPPRSLRLQRRGLKKVSYNENEEEEEQKPGKSTRRKLNMSPATPSRSSKSVRTKQKGYKLDVSLTSSESDVSDSDGDFTCSSSQSETEDETFTPTKTPHSSRKPSRSETPKSARKSLSYTPTLPQRNKPCTLPTTPLEVAKARLHISAIPESLPTREQEMGDIYSFVEGKLLSNSGGCMYISGVPGTGKTATVHEVIRCLTMAKENEDVPDFKFIEINAMRLTEPGQCYVQLLKDLTGQKYTSQQAADILEKKFSKKESDRKPIVLLVDELDLLWSKKQDVLYNIFDWPSKPYSNLIVLAIANAMDLPERIMMSKISSRLGLTRKTFHPYTFRQLQEIIKGRMHDLHVFEEDAIEYIARKVASISGDARRALDIARHAAEGAEHNKSKGSKKSSHGLVKMEHVEKVIREMFSSLKIQLMRVLPLQEKLFLRATLAEFHRSGVEETTYSDIYVQHIALCRLEGVKPPSESQLSHICASLVGSRLLIVEPGHSYFHRKIRLNVSRDDVNYALQDM